MPLLDTVWANLAAALGIGLLIGLERERRKARGPVRIAAGIRTFALTSLLGGVAVVVGGDALLTYLVLAVGALAAVAYWRSEAEDRGVTTGVSLLVTLVLGGLAMRDAAMAGALAVVVAVLLATKTKMHNFVQQVISEDEVEDALMLAAATLVILPLIPDQYMGPYNAFNPRTTWTIVVLMMLVGAAGHVAQRLLGSGIGLAAAGFSSGFVSSAATIGAMGARALQTPTLMRAAVAGAVLSTVATVIQMAMVLSATSLPTLRSLALPLIAAGGVAALYAAVFTIRTVKQPDNVVIEPGHAFSLKKALGLALTISAMMVLSAALQAEFGQTGLWAATAMAGFADAHAATVSVAALVATGKVPVADAAIPILCALTTNTVTKAIVSMAMGGKRFSAQIIPGLVLFLVAAWLGYAFTAYR